MSLALVLPLFLLACGAGMLSARGAIPQQGPLLAAMIGAFSSLIIVAGVVVAAEAGPAMARYLGLAAVGLGALAMSGGVMVTLRIAAGMQDDDA